MGGWGGKLSIPTMEDWADLQLPPSNFGGPGGNFSSVPRLGRCGACAWARVVSLDFCWVAQGNHMWKFGSKCPMSRPTTFPLFLSLSISLYASIGFNNATPSTYVYSFPTYRFPIVPPLRPLESIGLCTPLAMPGGINQLLQTQMAGFFHVNTVEDPFQESASQRTGAIDDRNNVQHG